MSKPPSMRDVLRGWSAQIIMRIQVRQAVDYEADAVDAVEQDFTAVLYPLSAQKLQFKPEGMRAWSWFTMMTTTELRIGDVIVNEQGKEFRVKNLMPWRASGFYEYEVTDAKP